jgi:hypothetical protein
MGKLFIGHYGRPPEAESVAIALRECHQRVGLKPSDFVSAEEPGFFKKAHGATGKYLVFKLEPEEIQDAAVWRPGFYLLPLDAADVLKVFSRQDIVRGGATRRPLEIESKQPPEPAVLERAERWAEQTQPLLFQCRCPQLVLRLDPPWGFRRRWAVRLTCRKRCQPPVRGTV